MIRLTRIRTILISLGISILILVVPAFVSRRVRLEVASLFDPITSSARGIFGGIRMRLKSFGKGTELQQELAEERRKRLELETRLAERTEELALYKKTHANSRKLLALLERSRFRGEALAANVIRRPGKWESHELIIDRGTSGGVSRGCAVLAGEAVLGVVAEASMDSARILTLGNPELAVPARIIQTRQEGLVEFSNRKLKLNYVVRDQDRLVKRGYTIITSGLAGIFPPGCLVGAVGPGVAPAEGKPFYDINVVIPESAANPEVVWVLVKDK